MKQMMRSQHLTSREAAGTLAQEDGIEFHRSKMDVCRAVAPQPLVVLSDTSGEKTAGASHLTDKQRGRTSRLQSRANPVLL